MIETLQIKNFGANKEKDIELSPQVTTITGRSYIGKSWILRALRWVALNKPAGDSFINWDANKAKVKLTIDDKRIVRTRTRGKSTNTYKLSGREKPYVAFGREEVPRDISEIVNLSDVNFPGNLGRNLGQHSPPFWFCETAGEVSRQLNSIVNLELIDKTLSNIALEMRKSKAVIEIIEEALTKAVQQKKELAFADDLDQDLGDVEGLQKRHGEKARERSTIDEKVKLVAKYRSMRENAAERASGGLTVLSVGDRCRETAESAERLCKLVGSGKVLQDTLKRRPPSLSPLERLKEKMEQAIAQCDDLDTLIESIENRGNETCQTEEELKGLKTQLRQIAGGRCPLCGAKMS